MPQVASSTKRALSGALALAAAMGIGRFAYTALLPGVQRALSWDDAAGGAVASANLVGYLAGVLVARRLSAASGPRFLRLGLVATAATTALAAASSTMAGWAVIRFLSGVASGLVFVAGSTAALDTGPEVAPRPGILYTGVGLGIALSATAAALVPEALGWRAPWLLLAAVAAVLALPAWRELSAPHVGQPPPGTAPGAPPVPRGPGFSFGQLAAAYTLEGLGYIVSGTFAVVAVRRTPGLEALAPWTWALAGLAAVPSAPLWGVLGRRRGLRTALVAAHLTQAFGMALPALSSSGAAAALGAILFGGTFMGIVTLAMSAARLLAPGALGRAVGTLTALYGAGQILGPLLAGAAARRLGDPRPAVLAAALAVAAGGLVLAWPGRDPVPEPAISE